MSHHESAARGDDGRLVDRMVFFSDAVFAIVLTLLVLELRPPHAEVRTDEELLRGLLELGRSYVAFTFSFLLTSVFWAAHIRITRRLRVFDWPVTLLNLLFLFSITLMPFASALLGEHIASALAMQVYGGVLIWASLSQVLLWIAVCRDNGRLVGGVTAREFWAGLLRGATPGLIFTIVIVMIAYGRIDLARWAPMAIAPLLLATRWIVGKQRQTPPPPPA